MTPIVYTKPGCAACIATHREMAKWNIYYVEIDVSKNPEEMERLAELGIQQMPAVHAMGEYWTGFRPDKIKELRVPGE
jgi:glutaredoxin-like protein NrdH